MTVSELIDKLECIPGDFLITFELGDAYGSAYIACPDDIKVDIKRKEVELVEFRF